jgi:hypothetical protein
MKASHKLFLFLLAIALIVVITFTRHQVSKDVPEYITSHASIMPDLEPKVSTDVTRVASCACGQLTVTCVGPDPDRVVMCNCHLCQKQTGSPFSLQARFPNEQVTIKGKSLTWTFPPKDGVTPVTGRTCAGSDGITNSSADVVTSHFCPVCGSTVYYYRRSDPARTGVKVGAFADETFPAPIGSGFEEYAHPWTKNLSALPMPLGHHQ